MLKQLSLILLALLALAALLLALAWREPARMASRAAAIDAAAAENGAHLYRSHCAGCHGAAGLGIPGLAPALNHPDYFQRRLAEVGYPGDLRAYTEAAIAAGRPVNQGQYGAIMPAWSQAYGGALRPDEIRDLASFILQWEQGVAPANVAPAPAQPAASAAVQRGKAVFFGPIGCLGCHGEPGSGGVSGPDLAGIARRAASQVPGLTAEQVIRQSILAPGALISAGCRSATCPDLMPRDYSTRLRQAELDALVAYLLTLDAGGPVIQPPEASAASAALPAAAATPVPTLRPPAGDRALGKTLYAQECAPCHGPTGEGAWAGSLASVFNSVEPWQYVRAAMEQGIPGVTMPAWGQRAGGVLDDQQLDAIAAYIAGWPEERMSVQATAAESGSVSSPAVVGLWFVGLLVLGPALLAAAQREKKKPAPRLEE
jgi:mono/diheme cytochrome c family protein